MRAVDGLPYGIANAGTDWPMTAMLQCLPDAVSLMCSRGQRAEGKSKRMMEKAAVWVLSGRMRLAVLSSSFKNEGRRVSHGSGAPPERVMTRGVNSRVLGQ
jgi:hypothetical protein